MDGLGGRCRRHSQNPHRRCRSPQLGARDRLDRSLAARDRRASLGLAGPIRELRWHRFRIICFVRSIGPERPSGSAATAPRGRAEVQQIPLRPWPRRIRCVRFEATSLSDAAAEANFARTRQEREARRGIALWTGWAKPLSALPYSGNSKMAIRKAPAGIGRRRQWAEGGVLRGRG